MYQTEIGDNLLINSYLSGNEKSLEDLIARHKERVYSYIMMMVKDEAMADDLFQDVFIKVIKTLKKGEYNEEGKFLPWVLRIAHNLIIDAFRRAKRVPHISGDEGENNLFSRLELKENNIEDELIGAQIQSDVVKLIEFLPDDQKQVLKMRIFNDLSFKEIAEETDVSINTALGRMRYALINMRKLIKEHNIHITQF
jgi:RNA polymerase sigma factor (sigma-70 family)